MFKSERTDSILNILRERKHATVDYLAERVYASKVTVRRDLKKLEDLGLVVRSYGGVTLLDIDNKTVPLVIREQDKSSVKDKIARQAATMIPDGSTVFMDGSSTVLRISNYLNEKRNITVITNSLRVASTLCEKKIKVYCTGGLLVHGSYVCIGGYSHSMIESMTADLMFFSSQGLSADGLISDFSETETALRRLMMQHSRKKYFLCDSSKFGKSFLFTVCHFSELDGVICDVDAAKWLEGNASILPAAQ